MAENQIEYLDWGLISYGEALEKQRQRFADLKAERVGDALILCQHPTVITYGSSATETSLLTDSETLARNAISLYKIERGGDYTCHGPGQVVAYPIINLTHYRTDVGWYMRTLEEVIIQSLNQFGISTFRIPGKTGVWATDQQKIASLGVKISRWCTMHGIAVNLTKESEIGFSHIIPCGIAGANAVSAERILNTTVSLESFTKILLEQFCLQFGCHIQAL